jgi:hypothetical protein
MLLSNYINYNYRNISGILKVIETLSATEFEMDSSRRSICFFRLNKLDVNHIRFKWLYSGMKFSTIIINGALMID